MDANAIYARDLAELGFLERSLTEAGLPCRLIEPTEGVPIPALLAATEAGEDGRERYLTFTFVPLADEDIGDIRLLQLYTVVSPAVQADRRAELAELLMTVNGRMPLGHFGLNEASELYYRYVWAVSDKHRLPDPETLHVTDLFLMTLGMFGQMAGNVADGRLTAAEALADLDA
ncbi:YbjN domain-containing protein [Cohnella sp. 56]|uniref:YbjN domain-containing protein n=1 Tax=Cohnella sp. 56 TaxID=3113722 RepID=UPI0030E9A851